MLESGIFTITEWSTLQQKVELDVQQVSEGIKKVSQEVNEVISAIGFVHSIQKSFYVPSFESLYFYTCIFLLSFLGAAISDRLSKVNLKTYTIAFFMLEPYSEQPRLFRMVALSFLLTILIKTLFVSENQKQS